MYRITGRQCATCGRQGPSRTVFRVAAAGTAQTFLCFGCLDIILCEIELTPRVREKVMTKWRR
jgi:hypothetical protein